MAEVIWTAAQIAVAAKRISGSQIRLPETGGGAPRHAVATAQIANSTPVSTANSVQAQSTTLASGNGLSTTSSSSGAKTSRSGFIELISRSQL